MIKNESLAEILKTSSADFSKIKAKKNKRDSGKLSAFILSYLPGQ
jgi:hypothetical protein